MKYLTYAGIFLVAAVIAIVLIIAERGKRDALQEQLSQADTRVLLVEDSLKVSMAETSGLKVQLSEKSSERDSLKTLWEESDSDPWRDLKRAQDLQARGALVQQSQSGGSL